MKRISQEQSPLQDLKSKLPANSKKQAAPSAKLPVQNPLETPAAVVAVGTRTKEEGSEPTTYSPAEIRGKALSFLESGKGSPEERAIIAKHLGLEKPKK